MQRYESDVRRFMESMGQPFGTCDEGTILLRERLIKEETFETVAAINNRDMLETIDGFCDCLYVGIGAALALGVQLSRFYPTCPEPDDSMSEPKIVDPEEAINLLRGAYTVASFALEMNDLSMIAPALTGYVAIIFSLADGFNIPIRSFWEEVQRSNLAKVGGPIREDGKRLKPPGWTPPDHLSVYRELFGKGPA
jgi:predicted HAD superfamily Cof-like phosphohydrolase